MLTPRRDLIKQSKSISGTLYSKIQRADSEPVKQLSLSFNGAVSPSRTIFENTGANDESSPAQSAKVVPNKTPKAQNEDDHSNDDVVRMTTPCTVAGQEKELNIEGALTDELKILQDKNRHLYQQIEVSFHSWLAIESTVA